MAKITEIEFEGITEFFEEINQELKFNLVAYNKLNFKLKKLISFEKYCELVIQKRKLNVLSVLIENE